MLIVWFQTIEGTEIQLDCAKTDAIVVSTLAEAYYVINSRLVSSGKLKDVLFGFPVSPDRFDDVYHLSQRVEKFCIFIGKCECRSLLSTTVIKGVNLLQIITRL